MTFKELKIGQVFDWVNPERPHENSFYDRCKKISARKYAGLVNGRVYTVGTVRAKVFNVVTP